MFALLAFLTSFSALTMLIAGGLSLLRNPSKKEHQWFFLLTLVLAVWVPINFLDSNVTSSTLITQLVKLDFSFALLIAWLLPQFMTSLIKGGGLSKVHPAPYLAQNTSFRILTMLINVGLIIGIISGELLGASIENGELVVTTSNLFLIYIAAIVGYFVYALFVLGKAYLHSSQTDRQGLELIWLGFFIAVSANILTNLVFPEIVDSRTIVQELNLIGYLGLLALVVCVYIAITSKKLFDIRLVVARSLAYVLLIVFIAACYAGVTTLLSVAITGSHTSSALIITNIVLIFVAAITFQYVRNFFTRITSRIFFRDSYEPQKVLNDLNAIVTSTLDLDILTHKTIALLEGTIKSSFCSFVLRDGGDKIRTFNSPHTPQTLNTISRSIDKILRPHTPLVTDYIENHGKLKKQMDDMRLELVVPLYANKSFIGFTALGIKENGAAYNQQDIELLSLAADSLSVAVQNALRFEEIENFNITLQGKVDEATKKLRHANEKLRELDETKDDFISMASHQLRTPLTSVKGYISMVLEGDAGKLSHMQREMLGQSFFSSQRMVYLIADLLNVSRLKTGKFIIESTPVDLAEMVEQELSQLEETAASHSLTLTYDKPKNFPTVMLDETKTRQVIMNFVDNAIYYTPAKGHINVQLSDNHSSIELKVADDGIGVPKSEQPHLFTKFYRAGNARQARPDGTGLGLFMAKKVIVAQGGSLIFESQEGKGSTFGFSFSKHKLPHTTQAATKAAAEKTEKVPDESIKQVKETEKPHKKPEKAVPIE